MDLSHPDAVRLLADLLARDAAVRFTVTGASMRPFLRGGETVLLRRAPAGGIRLGDLLLTERAEAAGRRLLLHRVTGIRRRPGLPALIQTHGDALWAPDEPVAEDQVLGRVCEVLAGPAPGRAVSLETRGQRLRGLALALHRKVRWQGALAWAALRHRL